MLMKTGKMIAFGLVFLAALALSGCVSDSGDLMNFSEIYRGAGFVSVAAAAVLLSAMFVSLGYMFGQAFRQPQLVAWSKNELYQVLASALLVALMLWVVTALSSFTYDMMTVWNPGTGPGMLCSGIAADAPPEEGASAATGWTTSYHIDCARAVVQDTGNKLVWQASQLVSVNMRLQFLVGFSKNFDISFNVPSYTGLNPGYPWPYITGTATGISFSPYAGLSMLSDAVTFIMPFFFGWIASFIAQDIVLSMISDSLFPILMVLGIILRTFFFTRKLGGLLLAIALCIYTIYPLMYVLFAQHIWIAPEELWEDRWSIYTCQCDSGWGNLWGFQNFFADDCPLRFCSLDLFFMILIGVSPMGTLSLFEINWLWTLLRIVGTTMVSAMFIPLVITLVTVASIKGLSPILGGDVEIAGLTHLI